MNPDRIAERPLRLGASLFLAACLCSGSGDAASAGDGDKLQPPAPAEGRTMIVTSDSSSYCRTLSDAIDAHGTLPHEVRELKTQGDELCDGGQVRSGINRLRRALLVLTPRN